MAKKIKVWLNNELNKCLHCTDVITFYHIFVTELVFTFFVFKYQNHFEFPRMVSEVSVQKFWKGKGGWGSSKTPWNRKSWGVVGVQIKESSGGDGYFLEPHNAHHCFCVVVALIGLFKEWMHQHPSCFTSQPMAKFDGILIEILLGTKRVEHLRVMVKWCVFPTWRNLLFNLIWA